MVKKIIIILLILFVVYSLFYCRKKRKEKEKIYSSDPVLIQLHQAASLLDPRISKLKFFSSNESYTEDKNKIYICLKDDLDNYYNFNMLMYVVIHECAHALTNVIDVNHTTYEFRSTFENLLNKAHQLGLYDPDQPLYNHYCGVGLNVKNMQR